MGQLTESQLQTMRWSCQGWITILDFNMTRLNALLKVSEMLDVNLTALANNEVLQWDEGTSKFVNVGYGFLTTTTTSTTSTSTSTSTTTTTTSTSSTTTAP